MEGHRRRAVRLGVPALIVAALAVAALWRVGPAPATGTAVGTTGIASHPTSDGPLTRVADTLVANSVGREASIDNIVIREIVTPDTFWAGAIDEEPVFAVLNAGATRLQGVEIREGSEVTLIGTVRPAPEEQEAIARWHVDARTAESVRRLGTYLEVREIR